MSFVRFLSWVLPALGIVVLFIGETSALNLIINLNSWFVPIGMQIPQSWADNVIVYIFYAILLLLILGPLFYRFVIIVLNVLLGLKTYNNGFTFDLTKDWIHGTAQREMVRSVGDRAIYSQPDIRLNAISWQAKNRNSTRVKNPNGFIQSSETGLKIPIFFDGMAPADTYGITGKSKFTISIKLPSSDGIREGWTVEDFWRKMGEFTFEVASVCRTAWRLD